MPAGWAHPVEFRDSLALCALHSVFSLRAAPGTATGVVARYRVFRPTADTDGGPDLLRVMEDAGGPARFAREVLVTESKLPGTVRVRTMGIHEGLSRLAALDVPVTTAAHLRALTAVTSGPARRAWLSVRGFGPLAWSSLLVDAGPGSGSRPGAPVQRYLTRVLDKDAGTTPVWAWQVLESAARELAVKPGALGRAIWFHESSSAPRG